MGQAETELAMLKKPNEWLNIRQITDLITASGYIVNSLSVAQTLKRLYKHDQIEKRIAYRYGRTGRYRLYEYMIKGEQL